MRPRECTAEDYTNGRVLKLPSTEGVGQVASQLSNEILSTTDISLLLKTMAGAWVSLNYADDHPAQSIRGGCASSPSYFSACPYSRGAILSSGAQLVRSASGSDEKRLPSQTRSHR
jgi:hypothetical protein